MAASRKRTAVPGHGQRTHVVNVIFNSGEDGLWGTPARREVRALEVVDHPLKAATFEREA